MTTPTRLSQDAPNTPVSSKQQMSASLRKRLQRSSRYYRSPLAPKHKSAINQSSPATAQRCQTSAQTEQQPGTPHRIKHTVQTERKRTPFRKSTESQQVGLCKANDADMNVCVNSDTVQCIDLGDITPVSAKSCSRTNAPTAVTPQMREEVTPISRMHQTTEDVFVTPVSSKVRARLMSKRQRLSCSTISPVMKKRCVTANLFENDAEITSEQEAVTADPYDSCKDVNCSSSLTRLKSPLSTANTTTTTECAVSDELADLKQRKIRLEEAVHEKQEKLRKLTMVKLYKTKDEQVAVEDLITKWRNVSQQVIMELHNSMPPPPLSLTAFIDNLQLDHKLIGYAPEEEAFVSDSLPH